MKNQKKLVHIACAIFLVLFLFNLMETINQARLPKVVEKDYTAFINEVKTGKIQEVTLVDNANGPLELKITPKSGDKYNIYATHDSGSKLSDVLSENNVKAITKPIPDSSFLERFFFSYGPFIFLIIVWVYLMKKMGGSGGAKGMFGFGKSKAKLVNPAEIEVTFSNVVGCDEAKLEAQEFVDFLKNPDKFSKLGGRTPRGLLLTGPAGTGKTMLAMALAKESGVPFFQISGSGFVEMFVGVGASRVRDMFEDAKKVAPCVLFIDEIDAIGGKRGGGGMGGGNDEREQTLNQLLVELDGMDTNKGVILVGATNRPETLDKALLRPGRIDRQIVVGLPDVYGREEILKIHSKKVPMATNVDLSRIARGTPGFSGAELANVVNESAIFAARRNKKFVEQQDFEDAKDKIMMGPERPNLAMDESAKEDTAYHEAGHAIVARLVKNADPVYKVTVIPRGQALGVTMQLPDQDRYSHKKEFLTDKIAILMGGRAAEEIFCHTLTNGASNDIEVATNIANSMVMFWGMSSLGPIALAERSSNFLGQGSINTSGLSQETLHAANMEVRNLINEQYFRAKSLLEENSDIVEAMTKALMEVETLEDWQIENLMERRHYNDNAGFMDMKMKAEAHEKKVQENKKKFDSKKLFPSTPSISV